MKISIPFDLNQSIYVIKEVRHFSHNVFVPGDMSRGDVDGPFDRGYEKKIYNYILEIHKKPFRFYMLDEYKIDEIYKSYEDAYWNCLTKYRQKIKENDKIYLSSEILAGTGIPDYDYEDRRC